MEIALYNVKTAYEQLEKDNRKNTKMTRQEIFELVEKERHFQNKKWQRKDGEWNSPETRKLTVLAEEFGEVARAILEEGLHSLKEELIQVAAVTFAWLETLE